jgi:hypothetical protein
MTTELPENIISNAYSGMSERKIRGRIPVFINSYNQLTYLRDTIHWFCQNGFRNITVVDNESDHPDLLAYFDSRAFQRRATLHRMGVNAGPRRTLQKMSSLPETYDGFIFTDPDLLLPENPDPMLVTNMFRIGRWYRRLKVGLALDLNPEYIDVDRRVYLHRTVQEVERKNWKRELEPGVFKAVIDTTFFLYVPPYGPHKCFSLHGRRQTRLPSIRVAKEGYAALHRPWLRDGDLNASERNYYTDTASKVYSTVSGAAALERGDTHLLRRQA